VLDPDVVLQADRGGAPGAVTLVRGAQAVSRQAVAFSASAGLGLTVRHALVNGTAGLVSWLPDGRLFSVIAFTVARGRIVEMDVLADPARLARLDLSGLHG
jgi:hypothetical protein